MAIWVVTDCSRWTRQVTLEWRGVPRQRARRRGTRRVTDMTGNGHARLIVRGGPEGGTTIPLSGRRITFGRLPDNDIVLGEVGVSRTHAVIERTEDGFVLRDLNSTNGTFVNRNNVGPGEHLLKDGDDICMAPSRVNFIFQHDPVERRRGGPSGGETIRTKALG